MTASLCSCEPSTLKLLNENMCTMKTVWYNYCIEQVFSNLKLYTMKFHNEHKSNDPYIRTYAIATPESSICI